MEKSTSIRQCLCSALLVPMLSFASEVGSSPEPALGEPFEKLFQSPPNNTKPRCYWYWMQEISKEGITKDLEAMERIGIGEAYIGIIGGSKIKALSDEWWKILEYAIREAGRIGVDIGIFNGPGWSQSGGPWNKPTQAMRYVTVKETRVQGPTSFEGKLESPAGDFQDLALLAFPAPAGEESVAKIVLCTPKSVHFESPEPFTARSIRLYPDKAIHAGAELFASDDGKSYRSIKKFQLGRDARCPRTLSPVIASFPAVSARYFRLNFQQPTEVKTIKLSAAAYLDNPVEKALVMIMHGPLPGFNAYLWPQTTELESATLAVQPEQILDLSKRMSADGVLKWEVPPGDWIIARYFMQPTGAHNVPAPAEATGHEVDKMSRDALKKHFNAYVGHLLERIPVAERKALKHVIIDSYEVGPQNWTDGFEQDFKGAFGYDPIPFLPAMTGRIVGSAQQSERFLWDLRRHVADRIARDYVGGMRDLCKDNGLTLWTENYGHWGFPSEFLKYGGATEEIGGEFWIASRYKLGTIECRAAASAAHIYNKNVVWAEAFTCTEQEFVSTPRELKAKGDWAYCNGINQFVLHVYIHQPWEDKRPGIIRFGTEFNRHNTWFEYMKPWIDYQRRCSLLLQTGKPIAEIAYFIGEDTPKMTGLLKPTPPAGYDYDFINSEVLLERAEISKGRLLLPGGISYGLLVIPPSVSMRPELLKRISYFVNQGLPVWGQLPNQSPSLKDYPRSDGEVMRLSESLKGRVLEGDDLRNGLRSPPDVLCPEQILWKHRWSPEADFYFISNQSNTQENVRCSFNGEGAAPELWHPETGVIRRLPEFKIENGRIEIPLCLGPAEAVFIVFRKSQTAVRPPTTGQKNFPELRPLMEITGPWELSFDPKNGGPAKQVKLDALSDLADSNEASIKYYSGSIVYRKTFELSESIRGRHRILLDLGRVEALAEVKLNGQKIDILWKPPYRVDITYVLNAGVNQLEVTVVNTWNNRLIGDAQPGVATPVTTIISYNKVDRRSLPLQPTGIIGPVRIMGEAPLD